MQKQNIRKDIEKFTQHKRLSKYMLFAGWEVRMVKNCDRGHSFSPYGPTLSR